jgi:hypothetical protein
MFNKKRIEELEYELHKLACSMDECKSITGGILRRLNELEKHQVISDGITFGALLGHKFTFTFNNSDGSPNGGLCNSPEGVLKIIELVKNLGGTDLVIKDESMYFKVTKDGK